MSSRDNLPDTLIAFDEIERIRAHYSLPKYVLARTHEITASQRHNESAKDVATHSGRSTLISVLHRTPHVSRSHVPDSGRSSTPVSLTSPSSRQRPAIVNLPLQRSLSPPSSVQHHITATESNSMPSGRPLRPLSPHVTRRLPSPSAVAVLREVDSLLRQPVQQLPVDALKALVARARALSPQTSLAAAMEEQVMVVPGATSAPTPPATTVSSSSAASSSHLAVLRATLDSICALPSPPPLVFTHHSLTQQPRPLVPSAHATAHATAPPDAQVVDAQPSRHAPPAAPQQSHQPASVPLQPSQSPQPSWLLPDASSGVVLSAGATVPLSPSPHIHILSRPLARTSTRSRSRLALTPPSPLSPYPSSPSSTSSISSSSPFPPLSPHPPYSLYAYTLAREGLSSPPSLYSGPYATPQPSLSPCITTPLSPLSPPSHSSPHTHPPRSPQQSPEFTPHALPPSTSLPHPSSDTPGDAPLPASFRQPATTITATAATTAAAPPHVSPLAVPVRSRPRVILPRPKPRPLSPVSPPRPRSRLPPTLFHLDVRTRSPPSHRAAAIPERTQEDPLPALLPPSVIAQVAVRARASLTALDDHSGGVGIAVDDDADDIACERVERAVQVLLRSAAQDAAAARAHARRCCAEQRWSESASWRASGCASISERPHHQQCGTASSLRPPTIATVEAILSDAAGEDECGTGEASDAGAPPPLDAGDSEGG